MWAVGVLAYELVVGRAPFEVKDESQTASMIMFSNNIHFPPQYSPELGRLCPKRCGPPPGLLYIRRTSLRICSGQQTYSYWFTTSKLEGSLVC